ncbi:hypothetical protein TNCV_4279371 [Trichonephila clavipes]|nr:hypothetical protein TNCV_4279371 [Trichonephila clavipes]
MDRWIEDRYFQQVIRSNHNRSTQTKNSFEFKEYYLDEWANMNSPVQLAEKLEEFEDFKRTLKQKSSSPFVKKQEYKFTEKQSQLMQICVIRSLRAPIGLTSSVENRQIKKELEKLIQDYKPENSIYRRHNENKFLKDEEPVCQHLSRRLAFNRRQEAIKDLL